MQKLVLYQEGIMLYNDDCLNVLKGIANESIDCVVTDCPYKIIAGGVKIVKGDNEPSEVLNRRIVKFDNNDIGKKWQPATVKATCKDLKMQKNVEFWYNNTNSPCAVKDGKMFEYNDIKFSEWLPELYRILKKGTHCYIMINSRNLKELQQEAENVGFEFQNLLIWEKVNFTPNKYYMQGFELILMLSKRPAKNINDMGSKNIIKIPNPIGKKLHPTEKPVRLMEILINNSTNIGDTVLDPFMGAGATGIASMLNKREFIGIEIDKTFFDIAKNRIENDIVNKQEIFNFI
jgi:DNA modification methylase